MANQIVNREINIFIQSGEAQKALDALLKKELQLKQALKDATDPKQVQQLTNDLKKLEEPIERARKKVTGELSPSFRDTQKAVTALSQQLKRLSEEDADYSKIVAQYKQANKELEEQKNKVGFLSRAMKSFWQEAKTVAVGVVVGNTVQSMLETVMGYVTGMVTGSAKIADELADIEKTTGLTATQVQQVNKELAKIDTRTSNAQLRELASEAGKLGKDSVADVKKFVEEADKINVALGEDLGENAIIDIAKTSKIFQTEMLNMASAINEIGANSEASEAFAVDFLKRLAGTAPTVGLAADQVLGYSAALEIAGQTTEVSATALNTFFLDFVSNLEKFGEAAGFAKGELDNILKTQGTNEAFLQFLTRLKQANPDAAEFINKLKGLGIDGARGSNVMLALANNIDTVRKQQEVANTAIQSNASIMDEFIKKNNNAAAELDKLKKNFASLFTSSTITEASAFVVRSLNNFVNVLKAAPEFIQENRSAIALMVTGLVLMNAEYLKAAAVTAKDTAVKVVNAAVTKGMGVINTVVASATALYSAAVLVLSGRISAATAVQVLWRNATAAGLGPIGVLLTIVGALVIGITALVRNMKTLTAEQRLYGQVSKMVAESTSETVEKMRQLTQVANDNNVSLDNRKKALNALIAIAPDYLKGLTLENLATAEGKKILDDYITSLSKKAELEAKASLLTDKLKQRDSAVAQIQSGYRAAGQTITKEQAEEAIRQGAKSKAGLTGGSTFFGVDTKEIAGVLEEIKILQGDIDKAARENVSTILNQANQQTKITADATKTAGDSIASLKEKLKDLQEQRDNTTDDATRKKLNKQIEDLEKKIAAMEGQSKKLSGAAKKAANDMKSLEEELNRIASDLLPDGVEKQIAQLQEKYDKMRAQAGNNKTLLLRIEELYQLEFQRLVEKFSKQQQEQFAKNSEAEKKKVEERLARLKELATVRLPEQVVQLGRTLNADAIARDELRLIRSRGRQRMLAELQLLQDQEKQELAQTNLTEAQKDLIREQYRVRRGETEKNYWLEQANMVLDFANSALNIYSIFADAKTEQENAELERDRRINEKKKQNLQNGLKAGMVSQLEYDRKLREIEQNQEKREKETRLKQFKRSQRMQVIQALMNGAMAITSTLAAIPGPLDIASLGVARIVQIALAAGTTAAQVAVIAKQKPPEYGKGGMLNGPSHADPSKGMPVYHPYTGQIQAYLEGGEGIGSKRTMQDRRTYNVSGTPSQIYSLLNGLNGGVQWSTGAKLVPKWSSAKPVQMNVPAINDSITGVRRFYATGGQFDANGSTTAAEPGASADMANMIIRLNDTLSNVNQTLSDLQKYGIDAKIYLTQLQAEQQRMAAIEADAAGR